MTVPTVRASSSSGVYRFFIPAFLLTLTCGFLTGSAITAWQVRPHPAPRVVRDERTAGIAVVSIEGIRNGALVGTISGEVRLVASGKPVSTGSGGAFAVDDRRLLTNVIDVRIPAGMRFLASSRGKKYYPVDAADAQRIVPANRVYFPDEESARRAGYVR